MRSVLDPLVATGPTRVAAICRSGVFRMGRGLVGGKRPLALLVRSDGVTRAFAPDGAELAPGRVEALCPGALAAFEAAAEGA